MLNPSLSDANGDVPHHLPPEVKTVLHPNGTIHKEYSAEYLDTTLLSLPLIDQPDVMIKMLCKRSKIVRDIPSRCIESYTKTYNTVLQEVRDNLEANNSPGAVRSWRMLEIFPLVCQTNFGPLSFDDNGNRLSNREALRRKLAIINEGRWEEFTILSLGLSGNHSQPKSGKVRKKDTMSNFSPLEHKVLYLCSKGEFSKAYKSLFPSKPASINDDTLGKLAELHPPSDTQSQWAQDLWDFVSTNKIIITEDLVRDKIHKSDHLVGPGPSSTTMDMYKLMMGSPRSVEGSKFISNLTWLQNIMANEKLPPEIATSLQCSSLLPLEKGGGKVRPIAMGETLRKLNASLILTIIMAESKEVFKGVQYGLESMGTEKILHSLNFVRDLHKDWDTICLDQKNAFNLIKRSAICTKLTTHFPQVLN